MTETQRDLMVKKDYSKTVWERGVGREGAPGDMGTINTSSEAIKFQH